MRNPKLTLYLPIYIVFGLFLGLSIAAAQPVDPESAAPAGGYSKFVHPNDVILPAVKYDSNVPVRNPFKSGVLDRSPQAGGAAPLERYELKSYRLTAVVNDQQGSFRGNLVDPSGMGHLAVVGTKVGKKGGQVTVVEKNRLVVVEKYKDANGKEQVNTHEYKLGR